MIMATEIMITMVADAVMEEVHTEEVMTGAIKMITPIRTIMSQWIWTLQGWLPRGCQRPWCPQGSSLGSQDPLN